METYVYLWMLHGYFPALSKNTTYHAAYMSTMPDYNIVLCWDAVPDNLPKNVWV